MKNLVYIALLLIFVRPAGAQLAVSIPAGLNGEAGTTLAIPVSISNIPQEGIATFKLRVTYRSEIMGFGETSFDETGTLSEGWSINTNTMEDGSIIIGGFAQGEDYITMEGILVELVVNLSTGGLSSLSFDEMETEFEDAGGNLIDLELSDGDITVFRTDNSPPEFTDELISQTIPLGDPFFFTYTAADADGDELTYALSNPPVGAEIDPETGLFSFTPNGIGEFQITATVNDGTVIVASEEARLTVRLENTAPVFTRELISQTIPFGESFSFVYDAFDADGDVLMYDLTNPPAGASIDVLSGEFTFIPQGTGSFEVVAAVSDGLEFVSSSLAVITVRIDNQPPVFTSSLQDSRIRSGETVAFDYEASDPDGDVLFFRLLDAPEGAEMDSLTGAFTFTAMDPGVYEVVAAVTDGIVEVKADTAAIRINTPPQFTSELESQTLSSIDLPFSFIFAASDVDDDTLEYSLVNPPEGATIDAGTGEFTYDPSTVLVGDYAITTVVSDGLDSTITEATLTVFSPVSTAEQGIPLQFNLHPPFPNPSRSEAIIRYDVPEGVHVTLEVFDVLGHRIGLLVDEFVPAGAHEVRFDVKGFASGYYLYRISAGESRATKTMIVF